MDLDRDVLAQMSFRPTIAGDLREMDAAIFGNARLGLAQRFTLPLDARIEYRAEDEVVLLTLDGLTIEEKGDAESIVRFLDRRLSELGSGDNVVVDAGGFDPASPETLGFLQLLWDHERSRSWAWYCTDPLQRRKLCRACSDADRDQPIHRSFRRAAKSLRATGVATITK